MIKSVASGEEGHQGGDRVVHYRDENLVGVIVFVDDNNLSCMVLWDGHPWWDTEWDFQWSNKLIRIPK